jgi:hypothetical protein
MKVFNHTSTPACGASEVDSFPLSSPLSPLLSPKIGEQRGEKIRNLGVWVGRADPNTQISDRFPFPLEGEGVRGWGSCCV